MRIKLLVKHRELKDELVYKYEIEDPVDAFVLCDEILDQEDVSWVEIFEGDSEAKEEGIIGYFAER